MGSGASAAAAAEGGASVASAGGAAAVQGGAKASAEVLAEASALIGRVPDVENVAGVEDIWKIGEQ
jgi:hypothetical protein